MYRISNFTTTLLILLASVMGADTVAQDHAGHHDHAKHMAAMNNPEFSVDHRAYTVPAVTLLDTSGAAIDLHALLSTDDAIALNFIFTTCTTICPVMTATFAKMQRELVAADPAKAQALKMISVSIDPEYDRPEVLRQYAAMFGAGQNWRFLTGDSNDIVRVLKAFDVYAGSKMNHQPVTLLRRGGSSHWIRVDGLAGGGDLARLVEQHLYASN